MSSSANAQNLLVNVFRPVYTYDVANTLFIPKLEMSNIDTYSGNSVSVFTAAVGDANSNVYVGSNAGNSYTTLNACRFVSAFGYGAAAGISNVSNSTFLGYNAGAGAAGVTSNVIIGDNAQGNGSSNVRIGSSNTGTGSSNVSIGTSSSTSTYSNCILLGRGITATENNQFRVGASYLWGNQSNKWVGIGVPTSTDLSFNALDVSGNVCIDGQLGINNIPVRTLDVNGNFRAADAFGTLDFSNGVTSSSNGFSSIRGTTAVSGTITTIGTVKKGVILVSAVDAASSANHGARMVLSFSASSTAEIGSNVAGGNTSIVVSGGLIRISDSTNATYDWSITYFPLT
jgi:hypothetical protein